MKSRILVAVIGIPILIYIILWGSEILMAAALYALAGIAGLELQQCVSGKKHKFLIGISGLFSALTVVAYYINMQNIQYLFIIETMILFAFAIYKGGEIRFEQLMAAFFSFIVIAWSFSAFLRMLRADIPRVYLLLPFILSFACDTFAYFTGRALGKHKLAPRVSPKKTIEGSVGGILGNVLFGLLFAFIMDYCFDGGISYGAMILLALLCGIVSQVGDLSFSLIKRQYGIKDYGHLFLEHGGVLDRFDSVLFVTPIVEMILTFSLEK